MDDMRNRYRMPRRDYGLAARPQPEPKAEPKSKIAAPEPAGLVPDSIKHAYQPPPAQVGHRTDKLSQPRSWAVELAAHRSKVTPKKHRIFKKLLVSVLIFAVLGGAGTWAYPKYANKNPFPQDIRSNAKIALFYPTKLPAGYTINSASMHLDSGVLTYAAINGDKRIVFTTQPAPTAFDFQTFIQKYLKNTRPISTPYGQAAIGQNQDRSLGSLVSGRSWFILSTNNSQISQDNLRLIMNSLKQY